MNIGSVIKKYRKEIGLTQEEMANRLGVTTPAVNKWENGNSNPDIELLAPIARLLNISLDTLLSFHDKLTGAEIEEIRHHAADSLFGFYLRKKNYAMAEKYLNYFSDYDPMKKVYWGRFYKEQGKTNEAYEMFEDVLFSQYNTLNLAFSMMAGLALEEDGRILDL